MAQLKIHYFAAPGRAEVARLCLTIGKVPYEDVFYTQATWPEYKPKTPLGQLPVLEKADGSLLAQSGAIDRYCAKLGGLYPEDPWDAAKADEVSFLVPDLFDPFIKTFSIQDLDEKIKVRQELLAGKAREVMLTMSKRIEASGGGFVAGGKLSFADLQMYTALCSFSSGQMDGVPKDILKDYPTLKAFRNMVASVPEIKAHYAHHTEGTRLFFRPDADIAAATASH